jgi:hypothetical protein
MKMQYFFFAPQSAKIPTLYEVRISCYYRENTKQNQPFDFPRSKALGLPFDKLKAPSTAEGLRVDTERRF